MKSNWFLFLFLPHNAWTQIILSTDTLVRHIASLSIAGGSYPPFTKILLSFFDAGETITVVGDHDPALLKYFDCTRSGPRSAFDSNVVYQFEIMEYVRLIHLFLINQSLVAPIYLWVFCIYLLSPPTMRKRKGKQFRSLFFLFGLLPWVHISAWCLLCISEYGLGVFLW